MTLILLMFVLLSAIVIGVGWIIGMIGAILRILRKKDLATATGVRIRFGKVRNKGDVMPFTGTLQPGQTVPIELHFVDDQGNDLGLVDAATDPVSWAVGDATILGLSQSSDGKGVLTNNNASGVDAAESFTGSAKGFTDTAKVLCSGGATPPPPPPPVPAGVKIVFGEPSTVPEKKA